MAENISGFFGVFIVIILFIFGLINQIKDRNYDLLVKRITSKRLVFGHKLSIWGFYGFFFFYSFQVLISFDVFNNDFFIPGNTPPIVTFLAIVCIFVGKYLVHSTNVSSIKTLY